MKGRQDFISPLVNPFDIERPIDWSRQFPKRGRIELEIGFGLGEVMLQSAQERPDVNFIGIEQHWERLYKTLKARFEKRAELNEETFLNNIKILRIDARVALERLFEERSINKVITLFPCPWPKKSHVKHRLFSHNFLKLLNSRLEPEGSAELVTDDKKFFKWVLQESPNTGFSWTTEEIAAQFNTKFERKWREEGQETFYKVAFFKKSHVSVPIKKDVEMKAYRLRDFDPQKLQLKDEKADVCVIFKDTLYDPAKNVMMIYAMVTEGHLFQHLRIVIVKTKDFWHIGRAEGQTLFPTNGIARAIKRVYECAKESS
ncbi:MAG: hypothetical protein KC618_00860 [Candidatus Omnitrophica bacterium]|nr:hypothetical protein [Candidatus Omnitrophota bacterium]